MLTGILAEFCFDPPSNVAPGVLPEMILPVEAFAALGAHVALLAAMYHEMQRQLLLPLEGLQTHRAHIWPLWIMALLMACQVILALKSGTANVANESSLQRVT